MTPTPIPTPRQVYDLGYHCFECKAFRPAVSPNRDFHNFTYQNYATNREPVLPGFLGPLGGWTDLVCVHFLEAPGDPWRRKAKPYEVTTRALAFMGHVSKCPPPPPPPVTAQPCPNAPCRHSPRGTRSLGPIRPRGGDTAPG